MGSEDLYHDECLQQCSDDELHHEMEYEHQMYLELNSQVKGTTNMSDGKSESNNLHLDIEDTEAYLFNIRSEGRRILLKENLDFNLLYVLELAYQNNLLPVTGKIADWCQTLIRKSYLTSDYKITIKGKKVLKQVRFGEEIPDPQYSKHDDPFEYWWKNAYPTTDMFEISGRQFAGHQKKNLDKEQSRKYYWNIINEGEYSTDDIYWATICQMENAKQLSLQSGRSELHYIPNCPRYLYIRSFTPFIEAGRNKRLNNNNIQSDPFTFSI
ncbi:hypothetical protein SAMN05428988_3260 [Chitinophaga sp. YR573]|uniref:hypothetical protein n=1 Tax=Chitinophaga sp. YR573 TaxID=1881040 RepID=UPI0008AEF422|nr:hypothetical protein [Chitinophaga sp. YR573]SEW21885.1 hypothetical protein SAMN05428988_3260 [Chitinophaga sp. YR573]